MSKTLQEIVQSVANSLDLGRVNSINDSPEAEQISYLAKDIFEEISNNNEWAYKHKLTTLSSSGDNTKPTHMLIGDDVANIEFLRYDKRQQGETRLKFESVEYVTPEEFIHRTNQKDITQSEVQEVTDFSGVPIIIQNDRAPEFWTSFDDKWIVFNSFDSDVDTTLQESKTQAYVKAVQQFTIADDFVPDIPDYVYPHFMAELKSMASIVVKQTNNQKFEQQSRRQRRYLNQQNQRAGTGQTYPNYGRNSKKRVWGLGKLPQ